MDNNGERDLEKYKVVADHKIQESEPIRMFYENIRIPTSQDYFSAFITDYFNIFGPVNKVMLPFRLVNQQVGKISRWECQVSKGGKFIKIATIHVTEIKRDLVQVIIETQAQWLLAISSGKEEFRTLLQAVDQYFMHFISKAKQAYEVIDNEGSIFPVEMLIGPDDKVEVNPAIPTVKPSGRPHHQEDLLAHEKMLKNPDNKEQIYYEWLDETKKKNRKLSDPKRHFRIITKKGWLKEERE